MIEAENKKARVLIVDDHLLYRECLTTIINSWNDFEIINNVCDGLQAVEFCRGHKDEIDLVLMDIMMPVMDGIEAVSIISGEFPALPIVMLTVSLQKNDLLRAINNGARGYVLKDMPARELHNRLRGVMRDEGCLSGAITTTVLNELNALYQGEGGYAPSNESRPHIEVSDEEREILRLLAEGLSNEEIGTRLFMSAPSVKKRLSKLMKRFGQKNRVCLAVWVNKSGLLKQ